MADGQMITDIIGRIVDLRVGNQAEDESFEIPTGLARLLIQEAEDKPIVEVTLPYEVRNILDPIVLGSIMVGESVHYKEWVVEVFHRYGAYTDTWKNAYWSLEMLSGRMKGHTYQMNKEAR